MSALEGVVSALEAAAGGWLQAMLCELQAGSAGPAGGRARVVCGCALRRGSVGPPGGGWRQVQWLCGLAAAGGENGGPRLAAAGGEHRGPLVASTEGHRWRERRATVGLRETAMLP